MPGFMYVPKDNSFQNQAFSLLSNILMSKIAYQQQSESQEKQQKTAEEMAGKKITFEAAMEGRDVIQTDAGKVPEGYTQNPYNTTQFIGPERKMAAQSLYDGNKLLGHVVGGKFYQSKADGKTADIENYEYAKAQGYSGDITTWKKEMKTAGATRISLGDQVAKTKAIEEVKDEVQEKSYLRSPKLNEDAMNSAKQKQGQEWSLLTTGEKEELIFDEMDRIVKESMPTETVIFGSKGGKRGWFDSKGRFIRAYATEQTPEPVIPNWQNGVINKKIVR